MQSLPFVEGFPFTLDHKKGRFLTGNSLFDIRFIFDLREQLEVEEGVRAGKVVTGRGGA